MADQPKELSKAEWELMNICWKTGEATARDIYEETLHSRKRSYHTIKTLLDRMEKKGFLTKSKIGPVWVYAPNVSQQKTRNLAIDDFVSTILDNTIAPLLLHFAKKKSLNQEEIACLKKLLADNEREEENSHESNT